MRRARLHVRMRVLTNPEHPFPQRRNDMLFNAGDQVRITSCEDDPRAKGKTGRIVDELPPGPLTQGRWTVKVDAFWIGPVLCSASELRRV